MRFNYSWGDFWQGFQIRVHQSLSQLLSFLTLEYDISLLLLPHGLLFDQRWLHSTALPQYLYLFVYFAVHLHFSVSLGLLFSLWLLWKRFRLLQIGCVLDALCITKAAITSLLRVKAWLLWWPINRWLEYITSGRVWMKGLFWCYEIRWTSHIHILSISKARHIRSRFSLVDFYDSAVRFLRLLALRAMLLDVLLFSLSISNLTCLLSSLLLCYLLDDGKWRQVIRSN